MWLAHVKGCKSIISKQLIAYMIGAAASMHSMWSNHPDKKIVYTMYVQNRKLPSAAVAPARGR